MAKNTSNRYKPIFNEEICMGCGNCKDSCNAEEKKDCLILKNGVMCLVDHQKCLEGQPSCNYKCVKLCPNNAITLELIEAI